MCTDSDTGFGRNSDHSFILTQEFLCRLAASSNTNNKHQALYSSHPNRHGEALYRVMCT